MLSISFSTNMIKKFHSMKLYYQSRNLWCRIHQHNMYFLRAVILWLTALSCKVLCRTIHKAFQEFTILTKRISLLNFFIRRIIEIVSSTSVLTLLPQSHQLDWRASEWFLLKIGSDLVLEALSSQPSAPRSPSIFMMQCFILPYAIDWQVVYASVMFSRDIQSFQQHRC